MQYMGSKRRIAKYMLPIMLKERGSRTWVEPFVGWANVIDKVTGARIGNDNHKYLVALLKAVQAGWIPPIHISKEIYYKIKGHPDNFDDCLVGFVGFLCSFGGKWWGGYAKNNQKRNYAETGRNALVRQASSLAGIDLRWGDYRNLKIPPNSLIYCDPPYCRTTQYATVFDHGIFWNWCRNKAADGHLVFVSEYNAPDDFTCVLKVSINTTLNKNRKDTRKEKLFTLK